MKLIRSLLVSLCLLLPCGLAAAAAASSPRPNIVFILADDLGYGDVQCLNPERGLIKTPQLDKFAAEGMVFTDAHTSSSVCTPTRYGVLTGRYNWRTHLQSSVLYGYDLPLIAPDRLTVASFLKRQGYRTAGMGKWHLGLGLPTTDGESAHDNGDNVDWRQPIAHGPTTLGFDYFFGIPASLDMPPFLYLENDHFVGVPTTEKRWGRKGPAHADFEAIDVLPEIGRKTVEFIAQQDAHTPFFAYVPLASPHTPILPTKAWQGQSGLNAYGDFTMQTDDVIGQIIAAVDAAGLAENTLIIVTSDNGCSKAARIPEMQAKGHYPSAQWRGSKADLWDGGHRVPFIVRWPGRVAAGSRSDQTVGLFDLIATCADILGEKLPDGAGEDSVSFLPALEGRQIVSSRAGLVHHSISGHFAYRQGDWKLLLTKGSGGWTSPTEKEMPDDSLPAQLYNLADDPGETNNLYAKFPDIAARLLAQLQRDVQRGRSTAGPDQSNDVAEIVLWKSGKDSP